MRDPSGGDQMCVTQKSRGSIGRHAAGLDCEANARGMRGAVVLTRGNFDLLPKTETVDGSGVRQPHEVNFPAWLTAAEVTAHGESAVEKACLLRQPSWSSLATSVRRKCQLMALSLHTPTRPIWQIPRRQPLTKRCGDRTMTKDAVTCHKFSIFS